MPLSHFALRPAWELIPILIPVAEALAAVARAGIVHRDVAPDNVLVAAEDGRFAPKLIDFGVAKDLFASDAAGDLTQHGAFLGKLVYAPPEQLLGLPKGQTLDFRADVYSFGLMIWELFSGRPAISATTLPDVVKAHLARAWPKLVDPAARGGPRPAARRPRREDDGPPPRRPALLLGGDRRRALAGARRGPPRRPRAGREAGRALPFRRRAAPGGGPRHERRRRAVPGGGRPPRRGGPVARARGAAPLARAPLRPGRPPLRRRRLRRRARLRPPRRRLGARSPRPPSGPGALAGVRSRAARSGAPRRAPPTGRLLVALVPDGVLEEVTSLSGHRVAGPRAASRRSSRSRPGPTAPSSPTPRAAAR